MFGRFLQRRRLRRYISKELVDRIMSLPSDALPHATQQEMEFVLVSISGKTNAEVAERMGQVADLAHEHKGTVDCLVSSLVVVVFGMFVEPDAVHNRLTLVQALKDQFDCAVRIVHGAGVGYCGDIGSETRPSFSFVVPGFIEALGTLSGLAFGEVKEVKLGPRDAQPSRSTDAASQGGGRDERQE